MEKNIVNNILIPSLTSSVINLITYNYQRIQYWFATSDLEIEYLYVTEFKKHFNLFMEFENIKKFSQELSQEVQFFYYSNKDYNALIHHVKSVIIKQLQIK